MVGEPARAAASPRRGDAVAGTRRLSPLLSSIPFLF